jgi:ABC-2 type transport system permease protein
VSSFAIAGYEVRRLLRDRALPGLMLLLLGLGAYASWNGADWVRQREAAITVIQAEEQERWAKARKFVGSTPSVILPIAQPVLPPGTMAPVSVGQADAYPFTADVIALGDSTMLFKRVWPDIGSPTARAAGQLDLAFVVIFLLPLVILAASYDLWSRERERGVAALVLSQPVAVGRVIAVKALALVLVILLPSTTLILALAALAGAQDAAGLSALGLTVLSYGCFWLAVVVLVSLFARRSTEAAIAAGGIWLTLVVMAPSLALASADLLAPPPSELRFATELKAREAQILERQQRDRATESTLMRTPAPRIPHRVRDGYDDRADLDQELAPMIETHRLAKDSRRRVLDRLRFFLPSVAAQDALDRIAGSDADRALAFQMQVLDFQQERRHLFKTYLDRDALQTLKEYDQLPRFRFKETGGAFQRGVLSSLATLLVTTLLILLVAANLRARAATP